MLVSECAAVQIHSLLYAVIIFVIMLCILLRIGVNYLCTPHINDNENECGGHAAGIESWASFRDENMCTNKSIN